MSIGQIDFLPYPPVWLETTDQTLEEIEEIPEKEIDEYIEAYEFGEQMNEALATGEKTSFDEVMERVKRERKISPKNFKYKQTSLTGVSKERYLNTLKGSQHLKRLI